MISSIIDSILECCGYYARRQRHDVIELSEHELNEIRQFILRRKTNLQNCMTNICC